MLLSLRFVAFGFLMKEISEILGPLSRIIHVIDQSYHKI